MPKESEKRESKAPDNHGEDNFVIAEVQLILAEKRTSLASLRTGIAVFALPLAVLSFLVATSKQYDIINVMLLLIPLLLLCGGLVVLGFFLATRAILRIIRYDRTIEKIKRKHSSIADIIF